MELRIEEARKRIAADQAKIAEYESDWMRMNDHHKNALYKAWVNKLSSLKCTPLYSHDIHYRNGMTYFKGMDQFKNVLVVTTSRYSYGAPEDFGRPMLELGSTLKEYVDNDSRRHCRVYGVVEVIPNITDYAPPIEIKDLIECHLFQDGKPMLWDGKTWVPDYGDLNDIVYNDELDIAYKDWTDKLKELKYDMVDCMMGFPRFVNANRLIIAPSTRSYGKMPTGVPPPLGIGSSIRDYMNNNRYSYGREYSGTNDITKYAPPACLKNIINFQIQRLK